MAFREVDPGTGRHQVFASGLRNPVGMAWEPESGALWTAVNDRDELERFVESTEVVIIGGAGEPRPGFSEG